MHRSLYDPVLVLNANYAPLNVCNIRRAMGLIITGKASLILNGRGVIRTVREQFPCPSIIRLDKMIKRPRPRVRLSKNEIFRRDNYTCQYCGMSAQNLTIDHVIPRRMGGTYSWENLVTACPKCNHRKGGRSNTQANMPLMKKPSAPPASALYIFGRYLQHNEEWVPFVDGW